MSDAAAAHNSPCPALVPGLRQQPVGGHEAAAAAAAPAVTEHCPVLAVIAVKALPCLNSSDRSAHVHRVHLKNQTYTYRQ